VCYLHWQTKKLHTSVIQSYILVCFECSMCSLHCLVKKTAGLCNTFIRYITLWCVLNAMCSLHCLVKKHQTSVIDSYITLWCVLNAVCVLAVAGKETSDQCNRFLHPPLVCFECRTCSLHCPVKKHQTSVINSHITLWCVLNAVRVPCTAR